MKGDILYYKGINFEYVELDLGNYKSLVINETGEYVGKTYEMTGYVTSKSGSRKAPKWIRDCFIKPTKKRITKMQILDNLTKKRYNQKYSDLCWMRQEIIDSLYKSGARK